MVWHYLKPNKSTWCPTQCAVVSVLTADSPVPGTVSKWDRRLTWFHGIRWRRGKLGVSRVQEFYGDQPEPWWVGVANSLHPSRPLWLFAVDLRTVLTVLDLWGLVDKGVFTLGSLPGSRKRGCLVTAQPPTIVSAYHLESRGKLLCLDLHNYTNDTGWFALADSLASTPLGPAVGAGDGDQSHVDCRWHAFLLANWIEDYIRWVLDNDLGMFRMTVGGQALAAYRHRFMDTAIVVHDLEPVQRVEQSAIYSGQVSSFFFGPVNQPVYQLDVNSLYPYVMANNLYPCKLLEVQDAGPDGFRDCPGAPHQCIAHVQIRSSDVSYPCRMEGRTRWVRGHFATLLAGPELARADQAGHLERWYWWSRYELKDLFSTYVNHFWSMRQQYKREGKPLYELISKMFLNSLWGKFAQRNPEWLDRDELIAPDDWSEWCVSDLVNHQTHHYRSCSGHVQESQRDRNWSSHAFPAISAFVTSYGREYMRELRAIAGDQHVYYQGCDSICVDQRGYDRLGTSGRIDPLRLGSLREVVLADSAQFWGPHYYRIGDKCVVAGLKPDSENLAEFVWRQESVESLHCVTSRPPSGSVLVRHGVLSMRPRLPDGQVDPEGWVTPLTL